MVRDGLTFGFHYPYINDQAGAFVKELELADALLKMITERERYHPRTWTLATMTCEHATQMLEDDLCRRA
jgi:hypothetical protein